MRVLSLLRPLTVTTLASTLGVLIALQLARGASSTDPNTTIALSPAAAAEAASLFVGPSVPTSDLVTQPASTGSLETLYLVQGAHASASVDAHDGRVVGLVLLDQTPITGAVRISATAALDAANTFLAEHSVPIPNAHPSVRFVNHGEANEFIVAWQVVENGVMVPDSREVGVNADSGQVFRYLDIRRPYAPPPAPKVDEAAALATAASLAGLGPMTTLDRSELWVKFTPTGDQYLAWRLELSAPDPSATGQPGVIRDHVVVEVNAVSGIAQIIGKG